MTAGDESPAGAGLPCLAKPSKMGPRLALLWLLTSGLCPKAWHSVLGAGWCEIPARATQIGRRARRRVVDHFDIERIADRYVAYYTDLLAGMGSGRV